MSASCEPEHEEFRHQLHSHLPGALRDDQSSIYSCDTSNEKVFHSLFSTRDNQSATNDLCHSPNDWATIDDIPRDGFSVPPIDDDIRAATHPANDPKADLPADDDAYQEVRKFLYTLLTISDWGISEHHPRAIRATVENWVGTGFVLLQKYQANTLVDICPSTTILKTSGIEISIEKLVRDSIVTCVEREVEIRLQARLNRGINRLTWSALNDGGAWWLRRDAETSTFGPTRHADNYNQYDSSVMANGPALEPLWCDHHNEHGLRVRPLLPESWGTPRNGPHQDCGPVMTISDEDNISRGIQRNHELALARLEGRFLLPIDASPEARHGRSLNTTNTIVRINVTDTVTVQGPVGDTQTSNHKPQDCAVPPPLRQSNVISLRYEDMPEGKKPARRNNLEFGAWRPYQLSSTMSGENSKSARGLKRKHRSTGQGDHLNNMSISSPLQVQMLSAATILGQSKMKDTVQTDGSMDEPATKRARWSSKLENIHSRIISLRIQGPTEKRKKKYLNIPASNSTIESGGNRGVEVTNSMPGLKRSSDSVNFTSYTADDMIQHFQNNEQVDPPVAPTKQTSRVARFTRRVRNSITPRSFM
ncbi:hypothetical protein B0J11DRAFT_504211 [Dendryphion nanum]|uniref:Uncharacterized protein n=1 Tax=Dendryphion nanum TaxID=256645 RepID=A0A9P9IPQ0_9PLEO|nr:hypothetical protein B0J11DRAFT_504211 [Dendryphion nanum]